MKLSTLNISERKGSVGLRVMFVAAMNSNTGILKSAALGINKSIGSSELSTAISLLSSAEKLSPRVDDPAVLPESPLPEGATAPNLAFLNTKIITNQLNRGK